MHMFVYMQEEHSFAFKNVSVRCLKDLGNCCFPAAYTEHLSFQLYLASRFPSLFHTLTHKTCTSLCRETER